MKKNFTWKRALIAVAIFVLLILLDQWTKYLAITYLKNQPPFVILPGIFQLCYLENRGAAFGMMQGKQILFVIMAFVAFAFIIYAYFKLPWEKHFHLLRAAGIMIAGGAFGNLVDRVVRGYVVDFFYFELIDFPVFNVADIYVTVATVLLAILLLFYYKEEELECLFPSKKGRK